MPRKYKIILAIILVSYLMIVLDISITITALPSIKSELGFSDIGLSWVQSAYTLAFGGLLLLGSRMGDIFGRRRMFMMGIGLFMIASLGVAISHSGVLLIVFRAIQGVGAAVLAPSTLALISANFIEGQNRTKAVAYYGAVAGIGASLGLVAGGIFTTVLSWRVGFLINLPIGIAMLIMTPRYLAETKLQAGKFDILGSISSVVGMTALVYSVICSITYGWNSLNAIVPIIIGTLFIGLFVFNERNVLQPIMPLNLFASRERSGAYLSRVLFLGAMMGFWFFTTQYLQIVKDFSPIQAGLAFLPMTIANFFVALMVPGLTKRYGNGRLLSIGLLITIIGMAWLSRLSSDGLYLLQVALPMVLIGIGQGATLSPLTAAGISGVKPEDAGAASGLVNVSHQIGGSLGLSVLVAVFAASNVIDGDSRQRLAYQISMALTAGAIMLIVAWIVSILLIDKGLKIRGKNEIITKQEK